MHALQPHGKGLAVAELQQDELLYAQVRTWRNSRMQWGKVTRISQSAARECLYHVVYIDGEELLTKGQVQAMVRPQESDASALTFKEKLRLFDTAGTASALSAGVRVQRAQTKVSSPDVDGGQPLLSYSDANPWCMPVSPTEGSTPLVAMRKLHGACMVWLLGVLAVFCAGTQLSPAVPALPEQPALTGSVETDSELFESDIVWPHWQKEEEPHQQLGMMRVSPACQVKESNGLPEPREQVDEAVAPDVQSILEVDVQIMQEVDVQSMLDVEIEASSLLPAMAMLGFCISCSMVLARKKPQMEGVALAVSESLSEGLQEVPESPQQVTASGSVADAPSSRLPGTPVGELLAADIVDLTAPAAQLPDIQVGKFHVCQPEGPTGVQRMVKVSKRVSDTVLQGPMYKIQRRKSKTDRTREVMEAVRVSGREARVEIRELLPLPAFQVTGRSIPREVQQHLRGEPYNSKL
mmetsp:Transcript_30126/g.54956  ORF Transcript_30126/g.54956 Transcript_30126/m.54956 type:complete len:466 (+) Transcript_30126:57-1454(+)